MEQQARDAGQALSSAGKILATDFYQANPSWVGEAAFALLMINMKDALQFMAKIDMRIAFTDDISEGGDVTDLISNMRNAICHVGSKLRHMDQNSNTLSFGVAVGAGTLLQGPCYQLANPYADDVAFFYGKHRALLKRHCLRAYQEADAKLRAHAQAQGWWWPFP
ncbi:hypothetical protein ACVINZ_000939 [Mesorhizobium jarvisii]